ncbi:chemotaxis protein CheC, partial [Acinetobacter baumannii]
MTQLQLNEDQRDALQEVTNIAMGQAASKLAELLNSFVEISIPRIKQPPPNEVGQAVTEMVGMGTLVSAVRQSFM